MLGFLVFIIACSVCFIIPGLVILKKININFWEKIILGSVVGYVLFTLVSYLQLVIRVPYLSLVISLLFLGYFILKRSDFRTKFVFFKKSYLILLVLIFVIGIVGQLAIIAPSGREINGDLSFWSAHGHDGPWHIALMEEIKKGYPMQNPSFAGDRLVNYHFFSDIAPAFFNQYFKVSELDLYFRFFPLFFSILLGSTAFLVGKLIGKSFQSGLWAVILTYFAGSFGYIVTYLQNKTIGGESLFWATQVQSTSGNPPQIAALIIFLTCLYFFSIWLKTKSITLFALLVLLNASLIEFKVYASIIMLSCLGIVGIWQILKDRKFDIFLLTFFSGISSLALYVPNSVGTTSFLIYEPWWYIRTLVVATDKLNLLDWELRRQTYIVEGNWKRVLQLEGTAFLIFLFGNMGVRFVGLLSLTKISKQFFTDYFNQLFILIIIISFSLPMFFLQKGVASNTSQFLQYFLLLIGVLAGVTIAQILSKFRNKIIAFVISILFIALMVPTQASLIYSFYRSPPLSKITPQELAALQFLKENSRENAVILTPPYDQYFSIKSLTPNIWDWYDTSYVPAFSTRRSYLSDEEQVTIMGYDLHSRKNLQQAIFEEKDPDIFVEKLRNANTDFIYFPKPLAPAVNLSKTSLQPFFRNDEIEIWQITPPIVRPDIKIK